MRASAIVFLLTLFATVAVAESPRIVVLTDSGRTREGLQVLLPHPDGAAIAARLDRGAARELVSVWRMIQTRKLRGREGAAIEPAYILLSNQQGGFARYGFYLDEVKKPATPFVDVHKEWKLSGELAAIDQLFPHELAHAIFHELGVTAPDELRANQVHAVAVRTDRFTAFNEGFAEHLQLVAVEHPEALPETRALANVDEVALGRRLEAYRREMTARFAPATQLRMTFPLWYSGAERTLRYAAVRRNDFARAAALPSHLYEGDARARAYLLENTLPGDRNGTRKPLARLVATEGVVSNFFYSWVNHAELQRRIAEPAFYAEYGVTSETMSPLQNVYLRIFHVLDASKPRSALDFARAYAGRFPGEAALVDDLALRTFGVTATAQLPPEIWLAGDFTTGTTIFDQFGGAPRVHTFDLNAASALDLMTIGAMTPHLAQALVGSAPYSSLDDVRRVAGVTPDLVATLRRMSGRMTTLAEEIREEEISIKAVMLPYLWRALAVLLLAGGAGAILYRFVRSRGGQAASPWRTIFSGAGGAALAVVAAWIIGSGILAAAAVVALFGIPAALLRLRNDRHGALITLLARAASVIPPLVVTTAWF